MDVTSFKAGLELFTQVLAVLMLATIFDPQKRGSLATREIHVDGYGTFRIPERTRPGSYDRSSAWYDIVFYVFTLLVIYANISWVRADFDGATTISDPTVNAWAHVMNYANGLSFGALGASLIRTTFLHHRHRNRSDERGDEPRTSD
ncbi:hypothetical protein [Gulosibacter molinativorax]|nr:hypothetical protein [Gulosibacter molinativorax]QUY63299.1 Hypotetical protein [Gulosibacter molinativorax]